MVAQLLKDSEGAPSQKCRLRISSAAFPCGLDIPHPAMELLAQPSGPGHRVTVLDPGRGEEGASRSVRN